MGKQSARGGLARLGSCRVLAIFKSEFKYEGNALLIRTDRAKTNCWTYPYK